MGKFSFFTVLNENTQQVVDAFQFVEHNGRNVSIEISDKPDRSSGGGNRRGGRDRGRSGDRKKSNYSHGHRGSGGSDNRSSDKRSSGGYGGKKREGTSSFKKKFSSKRDDR